MRGRDPEWHTVTRLLKAARTGEGGTLLIEGGPGTGKSLLLAEAAARASEEGFLPISGGAERLGEFVPLAPLFMALDEPPVREFLDDEAPGDWRDPRLHLLERLRTRLEKSASTRPVLVCLDDLQWAGHDTLAALRTLHWELAHTPVVWLLARRTGFSETPGPHPAGTPDDDARRLFDVLERDGATRAALGPLDEEAVAALASDLLGAAPDPDVLAFAASAGGNPHLLTELLTGLREEGAVEVAGGRARLLSDHPPERVHAVARAMLDGLGRETRLLVEAAAVLGHTFSAEDAAELAGTDAATLLPAFEEALDAGILTAAGDELEFRHELVWRAVAAGLPAPVRNALRHQAGRILLDRGGPAVWAAGDGRGEDVVAGAMVVLAMTRWESGRLAEGLRLAREAVRRAGDGPVSVRRTHPRLALAAMLADARRPDEARALIEEAGREVEALGQAAWAAGPAASLARVELVAGRLDEAAAQARAALDLADGLGTRLFGPLAESVLAAVALRRGDVSGACRHVEASREPPGAGTVTPAWCSIVAAQAVEARDGPAEAVKLVTHVYSGPREARRVLAGEPDAASWLVRRALAAGDRAAAEAVVAASETLAARNPGFTASRAAALHARGLLDDDAEALRAACEEGGDPWARASAAEDLGVVLADRDDRPGAVRGLERALDRYEEAGAVRDAARVRRTLREMGVRHRHWATADRPVSGWGSLTGTECAVALLVTEGWTNRQVADQMFISVHTVAFHLRQIFRKLGVGSRVELTRLALEEGHTLER
ncbi:helix-turn-helix transcriptional regulator [Sphaerisporangium album]|uniref:Helix-turn-helix transcriptional regulator n=1 Tax=Sphaerisporangium album TaxID=509200 RepID=A0A367FMK2_9ACTN|nr:AAA family ATPase [Sphaerisporangium album]RCG31608.1 helix-turn-helix transcriptional regulator [Sphaerisporangium album]